MRTDPLSDLLHLANVQPVVAGGFRAGGDWSLRFPPPDKLKFFALLKGSCWLLLDGAAQPQRVYEGDVFVLTAPRGFVLCSDPAVPPVLAVEVFTGTEDKTALLGSGQDCEQIGGHVRLDPVTGRLLGDVLPPLIHVRAGSSRAEPLRWLLAQLVQERTERPAGAALACSHLIQLMFLAVLRIHLQSAQALPAGTLRAIADRRLGPAMALMHAEPGRGWGLQELARAAAMSRSAFAAHFRATAGVTPVAYLTEWRMRLAEGALRDEDITIGALASRLGYSSESAFSTAFKRSAGLAPRGFREAARQLREG
ncbi:AraC family transcriptional regulator [Stenotrophomonas sp. 24(2023)]|uniref:AraC family transcriptional regulator n=1 Tax=Stenotrophomonas sp. 24(2023) TaxID=3068324 RepID=UPI0027E12DED|nr:AraC family transcriptional regulator [Stenotrophomonas sp. 24(2023)]WMJ69353.1 AraC family transcriptional regulator [Stenotrophomonas sp. 24(2023)]